MEQSAQHQSGVADIELPALHNHIDGRVEPPGRLARPIAGQSQRPDAAAEWEHTPIEARAEIPDQIADRLSATEVKESLAFADALTTGAVLKLTRSMAELSSLAFRAAAHCRPRWPSRWRPASNW